MNDRSATDPGAPGLAATATPTDTTDTDTPRPGRPRSANGGGGGTEELGPAGPDATGREQRQLGRAWQSRPVVMARALVAGLLLASSVPPWGWWPMAFAGVAVLDGLLARRGWKSRFGLTWLAAAAWLYPATLWMYDLTAPGYLVAGALFAVYFGIAGALTPSGPLRLLVLPGAIAVAELARWSWPFGGVPLAHLALSQVNTPVGQAARLGGPLLVVVAVVVGGQVLASLARRSWWPAAIGAGVVVAAAGGGLVHPRATVADHVAVALVQGGGPQQTRASAAQEPVVLARHVEASRYLDAPVDLLIWPENVVNPGRFLTRDDADRLVREVAADTGATVLAGWFFGVSGEDYTVNYQSAITPGGDEIDRYDKVRLVPFGEFVPLRGLIEAINDEIPSRDVRRGTQEPVLDTPAGPVGVSISWEGFFETRSRDAVSEGAELLTNPTNGSSYWLTQVQSQQVASNQLRAIENDRWVLQVAPTGFSAIIDPDGTVIQRTGISERAALSSTVEMRRGRTLASRVGYWPVLGYGVAAVAGAGVVGRRRPRPASSRPPVGASPDVLSGATGSHVEG